MREEGRGAADLGSPRPPVGRTTNGLKMNGRVSIYSKEIVNFLREHMKLHLSMTCQIANFGAKYDHMLCVPKITNW